MEDATQTDTAATTAAADVSSTAKQILTSIMAGLETAMGTGDSPARRRPPVEQACSQLLGGVVTSLAQLRQWMVLGRPQYCTSRRHAWRLIDRSMERLETLCRGVPGSGLNDAFALLPPLTEALRAHQEDVEDMAQDLRNEPALYLYWNRVEPHSVTMAEAIDRLARLADSQRATSLRRQVASHISETRMSTAMALAKLETYLNTGSPQALTRCRSLLTQSETALGALSANAHLLERDQRDALDSFQQAYTAAMPHVQEALRLRASEHWHLASTWLARRVAPCAARMLDVLDGLVRQERSSAADGQRAAAEGAASPWEVLLMGACRPSC